MKARRSSDRPSAPPIPVDHYEPTAHDPVTEADLTLLREYAAELQASTETSGADRMGRLVERLIVSYERGRQ